MLLQIDKPTKQGHDRGASGLEGEQLFKFYPRQSYGINWGGVIVRQF
jgi:hypothetical protein